MSLFRVHPYWRRLPAAVSLLLHLSVAGLFPLADAYLERGARDETHAHSRTETDHLCRRPVHDHLTCAICRVINAREITPTGASLRAIGATLLFPEWQPDRSPLRGNTPRSSVRSRAPPLA